jgi:hypothetical protein
MRAIGVQKFQPRQEVTIKGIGHDLSERGWIRIATAPEEGGREWYTESLGWRVVTHEVVPGRSRRYARRPETTITEKYVVGDILRSFKPERNEFKCLCGLSLRISNIKRGVEQMNEATGDNLHQIRP